MRARAGLTVFIIQFAVMTAHGADILVPADAPTIQAAIGTAVSSDTVLVSPGIYSEFIDFLGKDIIVRSTGGPVVTTISAPGVGTSVVSCVGGETSAAVLDGFTISGGDTPEGGGMRIVSSSPTVRDCLFTSNAAVIGGGLIARASSSRIELCRFTGNSTAGMGSRGGGLSVECATSVGAGSCGGLPSSITVISCEFSANMSGFGGGANVHTSSTATFVGCLFRDNMTPIVGSASGGGLRTRDATVDLINCQFDGNVAATGGAAIHLTVGSDVDVINSTVADNSTVDAGGAGISNVSSMISIVNSIIWENSPAQLSTNVPAVFVSYSDVEGGTPGLANIDADPLFVASIVDDYRLGGGSPCVDAGDNTAVPIDTLDLDADADVGESLPYDRQTLPRFFDDPDTADTGAGAAPLVDMGASESQGSQFEAPQEFLTAGGATVIATDDLDGDGDFDLIVAIPSEMLQTDGAIQILLNSGNDGRGEWLGLTAGATLTVGVDPVDIETGLFDGDALPDIVVANAGSDSVSVFRNDGGGLFTAQADVLLGGAPTSIAAGKLVGDVAVDLAVAVLPTVGPDGIELYAGNGGIPFGASTIEFTSSGVIISDGEPLGLDPGDMDEDKDVDLVWVAKSADQLQGALAPFSTSTTFQTDSGSVLTPVDLALADFEGMDDDLDVAVANSGDSSVTVFRTQVVGRDEISLSILDNISLGATPVSIEAADYDGDDDVDIVVVVDNEPGVRDGIQVVYNNETSSGFVGVAFGSPVTYVMDDKPSVTTNPNDVVGVDLNNDGNDDIATANFDDGLTGGSVSVLLAVDQTPACPGDLDGNDAVGFSDLSALLAAWGPCGSSCPQDLDGSGDVGFGDLTALLSSWGDCSDEPT